MIQEPITFTNIGPMAEGGTGLYSGTLTKEDGETPIPGASLVSLTLTLMDLATGTIINGRDAQNVLNANGVTVDTVGSTGAISWLIKPEDSPFLRKNPPPRDGDEEKHLAIFTWTWSSGLDTLTGRKKVFIVVEKYVGAAGDGTGSVQWAQTLLAPDGVTAIPGAQVWVTSDIGGDTIVAGPVETLSDGSFVLYLDPGSYYFWANHPSYTFEPTAFTVT